MGAMRYSVPMESHMPDRKTIVRKTIVMLSTAGKGGMLSVVEAYRRDGLFDRWNIRFIPSHVEGTLLRKLGCALYAYLHFLALATFGRIAVVHCHISMYGSFWRKSLFASAARLFGIDVILHLHGSDMKEFYDALPSWAQGIASGQLNAATAVLVLSESWRDFVRSVAPDARIVVLPNYVEIPESRTITNGSAADEASGRINVLFLGIVGERKGSYDLLQAFAQAVRREPRLHLSIGGNGEIEKAEALARDLDLGRHVSFLGWVDGNEKQRLLAETDVFVLPSYNEGLPVSVLEAMAWGIPVVTTPVGGIPELIAHGVNGFFVPPGDVCALQERLVALAGNASTRVTVGRAAREAILTRFSKEAILPVLESLYAERTAFRQCHEHHAKE